jgi:hypothetical protein
MKRKVPISFGLVLLLSLALLDAIEFSSRAYAMDSPQALGTAMR